MENENDKDIYLFLLFLDLVDLTDTLSPMGTTQSCYFKSLLLGCLVQNHQLLYLGMKANEGKCLLSCNSV